MIRILRGCALLVFVLIGSGCTSIGHLGENIQPPLPTESVFVLGVSPANYRVAWIRGTLEDGKLSQKFAPSFLVSGATDGFVIGKASAGDTIAIGGVWVVNDSSAVLGGTTFSPCGEAQTIVFKVPAGKIAYLGSVEFSLQGKDLLVRQHSAPEAVKAFLASHHPSLVSHVEPIPFELYSMSRSCVTGPVVIPVYLPKAR